MGHDWRSRPRKPRPDLAERNRAAAKHGMSDTPTFKSWSAMKARVLDSSCKDYPNYGGRGIDMDPRWLDFSAFFADLGERPAGMTLGRRDNEFGYWPQNCRWETAVEQCNNRRSSRLIEHDGQRLTAAQWADAAGVGRKTFLYRLKIGWPMSDALQPVSRRTVCR